MLATCESAATPLVDLMAFSRCRCVLAFVLHCASRFVLRPPTRDDGIDHGPSPQSFHGYCRIVSARTLPRRKHVCYIAVGSERRLSDNNREKIEEKARDLFRRLGWADEVRIDWHNAAQKLERIGSVRKPLDRQAALQQIRRWLTSISDAEGIMPEFADAP